MSDQQTETEPGTVGGGIIGHGPFDQDIHATPGVLWLGVLMICTGSMVAGAGVTALHWGTRTDLWVLVAIGSALGVIGTVVLFANNVMSNVH